MAINSFSTLCDAVGRWLYRDDLTDVIPDFVSLAESDMKRVIRRKTNRVTVSLSSAAYTLPADCAELRSIRLATGVAEQDRPIRVVDQDQLAQYRADTGETSGYPRYAAVVDGSLLLVPSPNATYSAELIYFAQLTPLSAVNTTNPILLEAPDIYLYGALFNAAPYLQDDPRLPMWRDLYDKAVTALNVVRQREEEAAMAASRPPRLPIGGLGNYSDLQKAIATWMDRDDLAVQVPMFISLAESEMRRILRKQTTRSTVTLSGSSYTLPTDCIELRSIHLVTATAANNRPIRIVTQTELEQLRADLGGGAGLPKYAAIVNGVMLFAPSLDASYSAEIIYYTALTSLSSVVTTNSTLSEAPDIYLYGSLVQAAPYLGEDARLTVWQSKYEGAVGALNELRQQQEEAAIAASRPAYLPIGGLSSFSALKQLLSSWINREDLTVQIPTFITLAETQINRDLVLRTMEKSVSGTLSSATFTLPTDLSIAQKLSIQASGKEVELRYVPPETSSLYSGSTGIPEMYTLIGGQAKVIPSPDGSYTYTLYYMSDIPSLSDAQTTNWLLTNAPDIYLYGCLLQAAPYLKDDTRIPVWEQKYQSAIVDLQRVDDAARYPISSPLQMVAE